MRQAPIKTLHINTFFKVRYAGPTVSEERAWFDFIHLQLLWNNSDSRVPRPLLPVPTALFAFPMCL